MTPASEVTSCRDLVALALDGEARYLVDGDMDRLHSVPHYRPIPPPLDPPPPASRFRRRHALLLLVQAGCTKHSNPIYSPDHRHVAVIHYAMQGALGADYADVFSGEGSWNFAAGKPSLPEVRWLDKTHLLVRYWPDPTVKETCLNRAGEVQVFCPLR